MTGTRPLSLSLTRSSRARSRRPRSLSLSDALPPGRVRGAAQTSFSADGIPRKYLFLGCVALALHVHWFRAWVIGMRKRAKRKKSED